MADKENLRLVSLATTLVEFLALKLVESEKLKQAFLKFRRLLRDNQQKIFISCFSYLDEGIELLRLSAQAEKEEEETKGKTMTSDTLNEQSLLNTASTIHAARSLSNERLVSAQDCFKASGKEAVAVFRDERLSIAIRIMACELLVTAKILESGLTDQNDTFKACLMSVKELHDAPKVKEMFSRCLNGGLKSRINKVNRLQSILSVLHINHDLHNFASIFELDNLPTWPVITLKDRTFHPILQANEISKETFNPKYSAHETICLIREAPNILT